MDTDTFAPSYLSADHPACSSCAGTGHAARRGPGACPVCRGTGNAPVRVLVVRFRSLAGRVPRPLHFDHRGVAVDVRLDGSAEILHPWGLPLVLEEQEIYALEVEAERRARAVSVPLSPAAPSRPHAGCFTRQGDGTWRDTSD